MDSKLLHDILRASLKMKTQKFAESLNMDLKKQSSFWQPWLDTGISNNYFYSLLMFTFV